MEGILFLHKGMFKGFKPYFAKLEENGQFILLKKTILGKQALNILLAPKDGVYPVVLNQTDFVLVSNSSIKYKFRAESAFKRIQWLQVINSFTLNLTDDL